MKKMRDFAEDVSGRLPLSWAAWAYNAVRVSKLLLPINRYPLADSSNSLSCQPLIFVSAGRSGTTLLRSMLVMGGQIAIPIEARAIAFAALQYQAMQEQSWYNLVRLIISLFEGIDSFKHWDIDLQPVYVQARNLPENQRSLAKVIDLIFTHYAQEHFPNAITWGEQSPQNSQRLFWVRDVFPNAKYLHILRDGRDVVASYFIKGIDFDWSVNRWKVAIEAAKKLEQQVPKGNFLEIRYADLVTNAPETLEKVCNFAGIDYTDEMLDYWKSSTTLEHRIGSKHENLTKPVFSSSIGSWQERLSAEQKLILQQRIGHLLTELGYT